jgi:DNA-binding SARP family transcriptional activator/TolB-like protein/Tfp pilus assembly protein PilF
MTIALAGTQSGAVTAGISDRSYFPTRPIVRIHLFGSMRATSYLGEDVLPRAVKARAILAYLCLCSDARAARTRMAYMLWDRVSAEQARTSFRRALSDLTAAMGPLAEELISTGQSSVRLNTNLCWIDALALVKSPYSDDTTRADLAVLCPGEFLEDLDGVSPSFGQWIAKERVRFKERLAGSLESVLRQIDRGDFEATQVATVAHRLISFDPTHQGASNALIRALAKMGEHAQALREYERFREALWATAHVKPWMETERLYQSIRAQVPRTRGPTTAATSTGLYRPATDIPAGPLPGRHRLRVGVDSFRETGRKNERGFGLSLSHEIAAGLARFRWFDVIGPAVRTRASADVQREHANLDYLIDGAISCSGKQLQISVRLLDLAGQAQPVWNEQFDVALSHLHRLDELVTTRIVARIDPVILHIEGQPKRRDQYGATGLLLLAIPMIFSMERERYEEAGRLIQKALALEPDNARAEAWAAHWHVFYIGQGWAKDIDKATAEVQRHALKAITLDPENAEALGIYAHSCSRRAKDFDRAILFFDRALRLNPSSAFVWALSAATYCYIGEPDIALQRLRRYRELGSPHLYYFETLYTIAYTFKGDYERAVLAGRRAVDGNPNLVAAYKPLIASLGHLGRRDEAQMYIRKLLSLEPNFTVEKFGEIYSFKKPGDRERYMAGLRLDGVPER